MPDLKITNFQNKKKGRLDLELIGLERIAFIANDYEAIRYFYQVLNGKINQEANQIWINKELITSLPAKDRDLRVIYVRNWISRIFPKRLLVLRHFLFDPLYLKNNHLLYLQTYYRYALLMTVGNNRSFKKVYEQIDGFINHYVGTTEKHSQQMNDHFLDKTHLWNQKYWQDIIFKSGALDFNNVFLKYIEQVNLILAMEEHLVFLQALFDHIEELSNIRFACDCQHRSKSKIKNKTKLRLHLGYGLLDKILIKYLRIIRTKIIYQRFLIWKTRRYLKMYIKNVLERVPNRLAKKDLFFFFKIKRSKVFVDLTSWRQDNSIQQDLFKQKRRQFYTEQLSEELIILKTQIIKSFHQYHKGYLKQDIKYEAEARTSKNIATAKTNRVHLFTSAYQEIKQMTKLLNMKFNVLNINRYFNIIDTLKIDLMNAYLDYKQIIVVDDHKLLLKPWQRRQIYKISTQVNQQFCQHLLIEVAPLNRELISHFKHFLLFDRGQILYLTQENLLKPTSVNNFNYLFYRYRINLKAALFEPDEYVLKIGSFKLRLNEWQSFNRGSLIKVGFNPLRIYLKRQHIKQSDKDVIVINGNVKKVEYFNGMYEVLFQSKEIGTIFILQQQQLNWKKIDKIYFANYSMLIYINNELIT